VPFSAVNDKAINQVVILHAACTEGLHLREQRTSLALGVAPCHLEPSSSVTHLPPFVFQ
jgi:hypothetical protein